MLAFAGIVCALAAVAVAALIGFAQGMSTTGEGDWRALWPAALLAAARRSRAFWRGTGSAATRITF